MQQCSIIIIQALAEEMHARTSATYVKNNKKQPSLYIDRFLQAFYKPGTMRTSPCSTIQ
jgi:hypothetical protein